MYHPDPPLKNVELTPQCWRCGGSESFSYQPLQALCPLKRAQGHAPILAGVYPMTHQPGEQAPGPSGSNSPTLNGHISSRQPTELSVTPSETVPQLDFSPLPSFTCLASLPWVLIPRALPHYFPTWKCLRFRASSVGHPDSYQLLHFVLDCWVNTYRLSENSLSAQEIAKNVLLLPFSLSSNFSQFHLEHRGLLRRDQWTIRLIRKEESRIKMPA